MSIGPSTTAPPCPTNPWMAFVRNLLPALALIASPALAQTDTIHFAAFGDFGNGPGANAVAELVKAQSPNFIVSVGDNCYGSALSPISVQVGNKYAEFVDSGRFWPALGNHEYTDGCAGPDAAKYFAYFTLPNNERYNDFVRGPVHFFVLNSNPRDREPDGRTRTSIQARWLKAKLAASTAPWQVVVFHHPAYSSGIHGSREVLQWPFEAWGVDVVLTGHDHDYERILRDDNSDGLSLPYFVTGLGGQLPRPLTHDPVSGSQIFYAADNGALFVTASSTAMNFEFRNTSGTVIDSYSLTAGSTTLQSKPSNDPFQWKVCC